MNLSLMNANLRFRSSSHERFPMNLSSNDPSPNSLNLMNLNLMNWNSLNRNGGWIGLSLTNDLIWSDR